MMRFILFLFAISLFFCFAKTVNCERLRYLGETNFSRTNTNDLSISKIEFNSSITADSYEISALNNSITGNVFGQQKKNNLNNNNNNNNNFILSNSSINIPQQKYNPFQNHKQQNTTLYNEINEQIRSFMSNFTFNNQQPRHRQQYFVQPDSEANIETSQNITRTSECRVKYTNGGCLQRDALDLTINDIHSQIAEQKKGNNNYNNNNDKDMAILQTSTPTTIAPMNFLQDADVPLYTGRSLRRETAGQFTIDHYFDISEPFVEAAYHVTQGFQIITTPQTDSSRYPFVKIDFYSPASNSAYTAVNLASIKCVPSGAAAQNIITSNSISLKGGCETLNAQQAIDFSRTICTWVDQGYYVLQIYLKKSTVHLRESYQLERAGFRFTWTSEIYSYTEYVYTKPGTLSVTRSLALHQQLLPKLPILNLTVPSTAYGLVDNDIQTSFVQTTFDLSATSSTPLRTTVATNVNFTITLYDQYDNPLVPIKVEGSTLDWPITQFTPHFEDFAQPTIVLPKNAFSPSTDLHIEFFNITYMQTTTRQCTLQSAYTYSFIPYWSAAPLQVTHFWGDQLNAQPMSGLEYYITTYTASPIMWSTTPRIAKTFMYVNAPNGAGILEVNQKRTTFATKLQLLDRFGNALSFTSSTSPTASRFSLSNAVGIVNHVNCPLTPTCTASGCCVGTLCTLTFNILHSFTDVVECTYQVADSYTYNGKYLGETFDPKSNPSMTLYNKRLLHLKLPQNEQKFEHAQWQCTILGSTRKFNCTTAGIKEHFCNTGTSQLCNVEIFSRSCVDTQTDEILSSTICTNLALPSDFTLIGAYDAEDIFNQVCTTIGNNLPQTDLKCLSVDEQQITRSTPSALTATLQGYLKGGQYPVISVHSLGVLLLTDNFYRLTTPPTNNVDIYIYDTSTPCDPLSNTTQPSTCRIAARGQPVSGQPSYYRLSFDPGDQPGYKYKASCRIDGIICPQIHGLDFYGVAGDSWWTYTQLSPIPRRIDYTPLTEYTFLKNTFTNSYKVPLVASVSDWTTRYHALHELDLSLYHCTNTTYTFYLAQQDQLRNEVSKSLTASSNAMQQYMIMWRYLDEAGTNVGESIVCSNFDIRYETDDLSGVYDDNGIYVSQFYALPTFTPLEASNLRFFSPTSTCFWDSEKQMYRLDWSTTLATPYIMPTENTVSANHTIFRVLGVDLQKTSPSLGWSSNSAYIAVTPNEISPQHSEFSLFYYHPELNTKLLWKPGLELPPGTVYSWEGKLRDLYDNNIYPILENFETTPDAYLGPVFRYDDSQGKYLGLDPRSMKISWIRDPIDGRLFYSATFQNIGALTFNLTIEYNDQVISNYELHTVPQTPIAAGLIHVDSSAQRRLVDDNGDDDNNNNNTKTTNLIIYTLEQTLTIQLYDQYGNPTQLPPPYTDPEDEEQVVILPAQHITANRVTLHQPTNTAQWDAMQTYCPTAYCSDSTSMALIDPDTSCCDIETGICNVSFQYSTLPESAEYNNLECTYHFSSLYSSGGFTQVHMNTPFSFVLLISKTPPPIYQIRCLVGENTDNVATSEFYLETIKNPSPTDEQGVQRKNVAQRAVGCNQIDVENNFCSSTNLLENGQSAQCPIVIIQRVCYDVVNDVIAGDLASATGELCFGGSADTIYNAETNKLDALASLHLIVPKCVPNTTTSNPLEHDKRLDLLCAYDYTAIITDDEIIVNDFESSAFFIYQNTMSVFILIVSTTMMMATFT